MVECSILKITLMINYGMLLNNIALKAMHLLLTMRSEWLLINMFSERQ